MNAETQAPTKLDLAALPWDVRLRIAVAETQGATWERESETWSWLYSPNGSLWAGLNGGEYRDIKPGLPNYPGDPAAWGGLLDKERLAVAPIEGGTWAVWPVPSPQAFSIEAESIGEAISLCVLAKHAHPDLPALMESRP